MDKRRLQIKMVGIGVILFLLLVVVICIVKKNDKEKKHPAVRSAEKNGSDIENIDIKNNDTVKLDLDVQNISIEFESYEIKNLKELQTYNKYLEDDFINQEIPSEDNVTLRYLDREGLAKESDLLNKLYGPDSDSIDPSVWMKLYDDNIDTIEPIIKKYQHTYHPDTLYVFVKAKITPLNNDVVVDGKINTNVGGLSIVVIDNDGDFLISEECNYIHNAQHVDAGDREKNFYIFELGMGEEREITMGFPIYFREDSALSMDNFGDYGLYIGCLDVSLMEEGISPIYSNNMISMDNLSIESGE
jgi:hypothetical protein